MCVFCQVFKGFPDSFGEDAQRLPSTGPLSGPGAKYLIGHQSGKYLRKPSPAAPIAAKGKGHHPTVRSRHLRTAKNFLAK